MDTDPRFRALLPAPSAQVDLAALYAYPAGLDRPWVRCNMVSSADGGAWGPSGRTAELSSAADRRVMGVLRGLSDVVLAGAATARIEGYRPVRPREVWSRLREGRPATPSVAVVTRTLDVHPDLLARAPEDAPTLLFTTATAPEPRVRDARGAGAEVVVAGDDAVDPAVVVRSLGERGLYRVLCEGGPHLLAEFASAGLLDELCLTTSPHLLGPAASRIVAGDAPSHTADLRLEHLLEADGTLFSRYTRG